MDTHASPPDSSAVSQSCWIATVIDTRARLKIKVLNNLGGIVLATISNFSPHISLLLLGFYDSSDRRHNGSTPGATEQGRLPKRPQDPGQVCFDLCARRLSQRESRWVRHVYALPKCHEERLINVIVTPSNTSTKLHRTRSMSPSTLMLRKVISEIAVVDYRTNLMIGLSGCVLIPKCYCFQGRREGRDCGRREARGHEENRSAFPVETYEYTLLGRHCVLDGQQHWADGQSLGHTSFTSAAPSARTAWQLATVMWSIGRTACYQVWIA